MFENEVLRKRYLGLRDELTGEWRKLHNAQLHALYSSPNIFVIRNLKSRGLRSAGHAVRMEQSRLAYRILMKKFMERDLQGGRDADGRIILKWI